MKTRLYEIGIDLEVTCQAEDCGNREQPRRFHVDGDDCDGKTIEKSHESQISGGPHIFQFLFVPALFVVSVGHLCVKRLDCDEILEGTVCEIMKMEWRWWR